MNLDQPKGIRTGEELPIDALSNYLTSINQAWHKITDIKQFPSGFSNLTYFLVIGDQEMVLRKPPIGANVKSGHDMHREFKVMSALKGSFGKVPTPLHYCADSSILGSDFYLMERINGIIPRGDGLGLVEQDYRILSHTWLKTLVDLHAVDYNAVGLGELGRPEGYNERQVNGWIKRYEKAKTSDEKVISDVITWLTKAIPVESAHTLIHNDYKYDNVIFAEGDFRILLAVLDWEMATLGDPLMDFGTTVSYWIEEEDLAVFGELIKLPTWQAGNPTKAQLIDQYAAMSGRDVSNFLYYYVFGLFKTAVVVQQIYYRYHHGFTKDTRFKSLGQAAISLCFKAQRALQLTRIDKLF